MIHSTTSARIQNIFESSDNLEIILPPLLSLIGEQLQCDRCFIYLRHPSTGMGKVPSCWCRTPDIPKILDANWKPEPASLADEDPMFAAALRAEPSLFIEDVETAKPEVLNRTFERENFGHRALIHSHLRQNGELWGVLQPCVFEHPRHWSVPDRCFITAIEQQILPFAIAYVKAAS